jgi:acrylyl-CoA reductase (NADPH)
LETTVVPFLLRGVSLLGIDSVMCPRERRLLLWERLARELPVGLLDAMSSDATLDDVPALARGILAGEVRGRVVISLVS